MHKTLLILIDHGSSFCAVAVAMLNVHLNARTPQRHTLSQERVVVYECMMKCGYARLGGCEDDKCVTQQIGMLHRFRWLLS